MIWLYKLKLKFLLLYENFKSVTLTLVTPGVGIVLSKTLDLHLPTCQILQNVPSGALIPPTRATATF